MDEQLLIWGTVAMAVLWYLYWRVGQKGSTQLQAGIGYLAIVAIVVAWVGLAGIVVKP